MHLYSTYGFYLPRGKPHRSTGYIISSSWRAAYVQGGSFSGTLCFPLYDQTFDGRGGDGRGRIHTIRAAWMTRCGSCGLVKMCVKRRQPTVYARVCVRAELSSKIQQLVCSKGIKHKNTRSYAMPRLHPLHRGGCAGGVRAFMSPLPHHEILFVLN